MTDIETTLSLLHWAVDHARVFLGPCPGETAHDRVRLDMWNSLRFRVTADGSVYRFEIEGPVMQLDHLKAATLDTHLPRPASVMNEGDLVVVTYSIDEIEAWASGIRAIIAKREAQAERDLETLLL